MFVMGRVTQLELTAEAQTALEKGYRYGKTHGFRRACQMVLLKAKQKPSHEIATHVGVSRVVVDAWIRRYRKEGIEGLHIRKGRGRKPILSGAEDLEKARAAVQENRQRLSLASDALQKELDKKFSPTTLVRFLKNITHDTTASAER